MTGKQQSLSPEPVPAFSTDSGQDIGAAVARDVRARMESRLDAMTGLLGELVRTESPTDDPTGLARLAGLLTDLFGEFGSVRRHPLGPGGASHLTLTVPGAHPEAPPALVLGHYDTVWPVGTIERLPCQVSNGILTGARLGGQHALAGSTDRRAAGRGLTDLPGL